MTDKNGKPLQVGDKVTHQDSLSGKPGVITAIGESVVLAHFIDAAREEVCEPKCLTLVEPEHTLGGIPIVTSEAVPKDEAWLVDPAKIKEFLGTDEGKEILDKVKAPNPVVTTLMGKVESKAFTFPLPEPDYKGMYEDSRELVRKLTRAAVAVLTATGGIEKAGAYARLRDAVKEAL